MSALSSPPRRRGAPSLGEVHGALAGAVYPARPADLAALAFRNHADVRIVRAIAQLPDRPVVGPNQVCGTLLGRFFHTPQSP